MPSGKMTFFRSLLNLLLSVATLTLAHQQMNAFEEFQAHDHAEPHHHNGFQAHDHAEPHHHGADNGKHTGGQDMSDQDRHLQDHLKDQKYLDTSNMTESEKQYHFFLVHDYDHDQHIDGIEFMEALFHGGPNSKYNESYAASTIDYMLDNFDSDRDGKFSFPEFMSSTARFYKK